MDIDSTKPIEEIKKDLVSKFNKRTNNQIVFKDYDEYIWWQVTPDQQGGGMSHEINNDKWKNGQVICIIEKFINMPRNLNILIASCGDGVCFQQFNLLGFKNVHGIEICDEKIEYAKQHNSNIFKIDLCAGPFNLPQMYDVIYTSHTLEHTLDPEFTILQLKKFLNPNGIMYVVLPYPDVEAGIPVVDERRYRIHVGVVPLGLHLKDNAQTTCSIFQKLGFNILKAELKNYREPEIHLTLQSI